jgi:hypothetical protein
LPVEIADALPHYDELELGATGILIGNGASRAVSSRFAYGSLYQTACAFVEGPALDTPAQQLFDELQTKNFEQVLSTLAAARLVNRLLGLPLQQIEDQHELIRSALVHAVRSVHVTRFEVPDSTLDEMNAALRLYDHVYSTNYDLLIYWAVMRNEAGFKDYFWRSQFDPADTDIYGDPTRILYLHGALHLYGNAGRRTYKRQNTSAGNLLETFGQPLHRDDTAVPLFVTEGSSEDKLRSIYTSDYLAFAYDQFSKHSGPLIIFGQSLDGTFDGHLLRAISKSGNRELRVAIHAGSSPNIARRKAEWLAKFPPTYEIKFFDSTTHPLGKPDLLIA